MNLNMPFTKAFSLLDEPHVMGEEDDLGFLGELGKPLQCSFGALVIKIDEDVIDDEWHGSGAVYVLFE